MVHISALLIICSLILSPDERIFVGSTPAHTDIRNFLAISTTDSVDFIRWKVTLSATKYSIECSYGISKPNTPGFINEKLASLNGTFERNGSRIHLDHLGKKLNLQEINVNLMHFLDKNEKMIIGNGGYSYALNNKEPVKSDHYNLVSAPVRLTTPQVYEGRTPCQEISALLGWHKGEACNKKKWYIVLYSDSLTGKPTYYLEGGMSYRKETRDKGKWEIVFGTQGRIFYKLTPPKSDFSFYLLKADDNILFFTDPGGRILVGNEDFSYTLNRRKEGVKGY